jgi:hypothetical protein
MRKTLTSLLAGAALAAVASAAGAQVPGYGYPAYPAVPVVPGYGYGGYGNQTATLYELPGYQGRSVVVNGASTNLDNIGFNDRTRSIRLSGAWSLCEDADFRSRCVTLSGSIPDLNRRGISGLSSLQPVSDGGGYPGTGAGVEGRSVVFYPGPVASNYGSAPPYGYGGGNAYGYGTGKRGADSFCRRMGNRDAVYYDNAGNTLADVLCRR